MAIKKTGFCFRKNGDSKHDKAINCNIVWKWKKKQPRVLFQLCFFPWSFFFWKLLIATKAISKEISILGWSNNKKTHYRRLKSGFPVFY